MSDRNESPEENPNNSSESNDENDDLVIEEGEDVEIEYTKNEDFQRFSVSNARGGVQPRGHVKVDFVLEYTNDPDTEFRTVERGQPGELVERKPEPKIIRERQTGIVMDQNAAFSVGVWLASTVIGVPEEIVAQTLVNRFELDENAEVSNAEDFMEKVEE